MWCGFKRLIISTAAFSHVATSYVLICLLNITDASWLSSKVNICNRWQKNKNMDSRSAQGVRKLLCRGMIVRSAKGPTAHCAHWEGEPNPARVVGLESLFAPQLCVHEHVHVLVHPFSCAAQLRGCTCTCLCNLPTSPPSISTPNLNTIAMQDS